MTQPQEPEVEDEITALEVTFAAAVLAAFTGWLALVASVVMAPFRLFGLAPDPTAIFSTVGDWTRRVDELMEGLTRIARLGWETTADQLGINLPFNASDAMLADQLDLVRNLLVRTPDEVYRRIVAELGQGAGETIAQQAARVRAVLSMTGTENWPARARTVAVTEVNRAYAMGQQAAALRAQQRLGAMAKTWDSRRDNRVRIGHKEANGQRVPASQPFIVAGEPLMFPGDPRGSPSNVINCRCSLKISREAL